MKTCPRMVDVGRRKFLTGAGIAAAGAAAATVVPQRRRRARSSRGSAIRRTASRISATSSPTSPCKWLIRTPMRPASSSSSASKVPGGVGPEGDIVGFTTICPHKGFPLAYNSSDKTLNCSGHYSRFDCENGGQEIWGHATQNLPQYQLRVDAKGDIYAEGVDELIYGRLSNVLEG